ncbi:MAG TPA: FeoB-associated Cys-rich membrane protein [Deltaproteobacteria bacterium]|nr:FeoB-associated Cys-rich membrane protein [Deltaproteobacteria bacterium]
METLLVISIVVVAAACSVRKIYKGLKKGAHYTCNACGTCTLCDEIKDEHTERQR